MAEFPAYPLARDPEHPLDPPPGYRELRASASPTRVRTWDGSTPWLITRYDDARHALVDRRLTMDVTSPGFPHTSPSSLLRSRGAVFFPSRPEERYAAARAIVIKEFTPRRMAELRPYVQRVADQKIDALLAGPRPADLIEAFALPFAIEVICEFLGLPLAGRDRLHELSRVLGSRTAPAEQVTSALSEMAAYFRALVADPGDGLMGRIVRAHVETGELSEEDAAADIQGLFFTGHGPTAYMIAMGVVALLRHPEQIEVLTGTYDESVHTTAVQELLRYITVSHNARQRAATDDIEIGGTLIRRGEGVLIQIDSANRDETAFPDPDHLDLLRTPSRRHLALGLGVHHCTGHTLAGIELDIAYTTLFRRLPDLRLAVDITEVPFKFDENLVGAHALPMTWGPDLRAAR
ncbi:cytochrome P450 [Streptomyces botrytidirepellens]|uniref:Cytochrome P450 n=1 Tax=Streptomyces botrytidirepellens TaxID=2486417 RepID=A0A3M8VWQ6_9ACTN|nr:cytochrome P450 [Streptomyces botrytidirepellens]RNG22204.1 cytochrome P450 [Streptomyces botrytidirepellens]